VLSAAGWKRFAGRAIGTKFHLGSTDFDLRAMTLDNPRGETLYGGRALVHGWLRGLGKSRLQELTDQGWRTVARVRPTSTGRFTLSLRATRSTQLRLAYNGLAGDAVTLNVAPRVSLQADGNRLRARVSPRLPLQVQRLTHRKWRTVARGTGAFERTLRPGSYRVKVLGGAAYASQVSPPVGVHAA
jgi:hypothetical protein